MRGATWISQVPKGEAPGAPGERTMTVMPTLSLSLSAAEGDSSVWHLTRDLRAKFMFREYPSGDGGGRMKLSQTSFFAAVSLICAMPAVAQTVSAGPETADTPNKIVALAKPAFDVVSIKAVAPDVPVVFVGVTPKSDGISTSGSLSALIRNAFGIIRFPSDDSIVGAPEWVTAQRYDIEARMGEQQAAAFGKLSGEDQENRRELMEQTLLEDRFQLRSHVEAQQREVYELVLTKDTGKLACAERTDHDGLKVKAGDGGWLQTDKGMVEGHAFDMLQFANYLSQAYVGLGRRVLDKTGLNGRCDFKLVWSADQGVGQVPEGTPLTAETDAGGGGGGPSLVIALGEQLGLRLRPANAPIDVIVIDHIEPPPPAIPSPTN